MGGDKQTLDFQAIEAGDRGHPGEGKVSSRVSLCLGIEREGGSTWTDGQRGGGQCFGVWDPPEGLVCATGGRERRDGWKARCTRNFRHVEAECHVVRLYSLHHLGSRTSIDKDSKPVGAR